MNERRISEAEFAPVYFRLDPAPISWSRSELEVIVQLGPFKGLDAVEKRVQRFPEKDAAHLRRLILEFLTAALAEHDLFNAEWFYQLMAFSPAYIKNRERKPGFLFDEDGFLPFNRLLFHVLQRQPPEERFRIVFQNLGEIDDLSVFTDFFRATVGDLHPEGATDGREKFFFGEHTSELRERLVDTVRRFAQSGKLWSQVSPTRLIWFWWGSNHEQEVKEFLSQSMRNPDTLRKLLDLVISQVVSSSGNFERVAYGYQKIINFDELTAAAQGLRKANLQEGDEFVVSRYLAALERRESASF